MIENVIGKRFAEALSNSIKDEKKVRKALENLDSFDHAFSTDTQLSHFFLNPSIPPENKRALAKEMCDRFSVEPEVRKMMEMLVDRKKMSFLKNIREYFQDVVDKRSNQARVNVTSAYPLSDKHIKKLRTSLSEFLQKDVLIETDVDESLIAGIKLRAGSIVADSSIKNSLALLKNAIENEEVISESTSG
jgi:F-type H+-transporting ATPase subunit delta